MATPNSTTLDWDGIVTATMRHYLSNNFQDQIFGYLALFAWLTGKERKKMVSGGDFLVEPLMYGRNTTVKSFSDLDTIDTQPMDGFTAATFNWKGLAGSLVYSLQDRLKNNSKEKLIDLLEAKTTQLEMSIREEMNTEAFADGTGNSGKDLTGLQAICATSGVLGGIDRATYTWWKCKEEATAETLTDVKRLVNIYNSAGGQKTKPDFIITTQAAFEWYEALNYGKLQVQGTGSNPLADLGFETLKFKGAVLTYDDACPSGNWFFLNSQFLRLRVHSDADFAKTEPKEPTNQLAKVWQIYWFGNLTVNNCRRQGRLRNKSY